MKVVLFTSFALLAFAGNSVLCRLALGNNAIDAASFTSIRLLSGILALGLILLITQRRSSQTSKGSWKASAMLFIYALTFSYAYISLDTGVGALILFTAVQVTMIFIRVFSGGRLLAIEWLGVSLSFFGFVYLVYPELSSPSVIGFILMLVSGVAWGLYTLEGRKSKSPLNDTAYNFIRCLPLVLLLTVITISNATLSSEGIWLAIAAGAITSGVGYAIWYVALGSLSAIQAAVVQLLVPVIATFGGIVFANEALSVRLVIASLVILGGISLVIFASKITNYQKLSR